jgi:hypothetical protein
MKKLIFIMLAGSTLAAFISISSCKKDDTAAPSISLLGNNPYTISLNSTYTDPGASANDEEDGSVNVNVDASDVNVNLTGTYTVNYTATDAAGNQASASRTVIVKNDAESFVHGYDVLISGCGPTYNYTDAIAVSTTVNNQVIFNKFGDYPNANKKLRANISGANISIVTDTINCGSTVVPRRFSGSGSIVTSPNTIITMSVTEITILNGNSINCTYEYTKQP